MAHAAPSFHCCPTTSTHYSQDIARHDIPTSTHLAREARWPIGGKPPAAATGRAILERHHGARGGCPATYRAMDSHTSPISHTHPVPPARWPGCTDQCACRCASLHRGHQLLERAPCPPAPPSLPPGTRTPAAAGAGRGESLAGQRDEQDVEVYSSLPETRYGGLDELGLLLATLLVLERHTGEGVRGPRSNAAGEGGLAPAGALGSSQPRASPRLARIDESIALTRPKAKAATGCRPHVTKHRHKRRGGGEGCGVACACPQPLTLSGRTGLASTSEALMACAPVMTTWADLVCCCARCSAPMYCIA